MAAHTRRSAFSLVELVSLLGIFAILAAIAVPKYANSLALYRSQMAAQRVAADLNLARQRAKTSSASESVTFSTATASYALAAAGSYAASTVKLSDDPYQATLVSTSFASATLTYDRFGQPSAGGTVVIRSGTFSQTVSVDANSGIASVQ